MNLQSCRLSVLWDAPGLNFLCRACSFTSDPDPVTYDFAAACKRLQDAVNSPILQYVLSAEHLLLRTYEVKLPPIVASSYPGSTDPQAREILQKFQPVILNSCTPLYVRGDGNCLFRALSRGFFGTEKHHLHIILLSALEMASQRPFYDEQHKEFSNFLSEAEYLCESYCIEFKAASTPGSWSSITHFYAASTALKVAFRSYCPPIMNDYFMSSPLTRKICGRGVKRSAVPMAILMWSSSILPHDEGDFKPDHFVVLQKTEIRAKYVDLTANSNTTSVYERFTPVYRNDSEEALYDQSEDDDGVTAVPLAEALPDLDEVPTTSTSDFQDEDPAPPASRFPDDELISPAEAPSDEVDHEDDGQAAGGRSLTDGKFLGVLELIDTLTVSTKGLPSIPVGRKENTLFIIQNQRNIDRRAVGQGCSFSDDCGAWKPSPSPVTRMIKKGERWQSIILRGGQYGTEKRVNGKKIFVPADQQPSEEDILKVHRMYNILKADENYERRATWLEPAPTPIACVEYIGHYPGAAPHGNAKTTREPYTRTDPSVLDAIKKASNTIKPREIYEQLKRKPTEDEKQHVPGIVLFTTQQIRDIWRFCCSSPPGEGTVLGVDKTFNLGQLHVTPTVFKHLGIVRPTTNTHPIFIGPTLIHGSTFFNFIKQELEDAPKDPVIGSDKEMAIRIAAKSVFTTGSLI
ncbi:hypothetical protein ElyMa_001175300 [Elysia marginata]|uniref:OTU domain-containing protein n=1 Tax=Elysia marginata TaxID=1093978 RepID=A0AAV4I5Z3_9GAST|nr:hypothetical protein ElyMa_001175300 [Elysia marginata]